MPPLPDYEQALRTVLDGVVVLGPEPAPLADAAGRVLREAVVADRDQPPFERSAMDGFGGAGGAGHGGRRNRRPGRHRAF